MAAQQLDNGKKMFVGIDLDGVIVNHAHSRIRFAALHGFSIAPEETPSEIIKTLLPGPVLLRLQHALYNDPDTSLQTPLMRGVRKALQEFAQQGIPFALISRRAHGPTLGITLLKKRRLWPAYFNKTNVFFVETVAAKNVTAKTLGITHYIDDEGGVLDCMQTVPYRYLFDPFGAFPDTPHQRVRSWAELRQRLSFDGA